MMGKARQAFARGGKCWGPTGVSMEDFFGIFLLVLGSFIFFFAFIDFIFGSVGFNDVIFSSPQTVFCVHGV